MIKDPIVVVSATHTPMGHYHYGGYFKETPSSKLGTAAIKATVERAGLELENIDEVIIGCVLSAEQGQAPARQAAIKAGLPPNIPCTTVNQDVWL
ncbi:hypothetical protein [Candidatus Coxiella mudrowiae]|uniref:thiolase family protein n=1 Tax=Candidatus Coxiella mudrowiae TaxID=2054173 RepID=UPI001FD40BC6|nr:hypothetical protein [Candidatus Coxiella mudrowiae]